MPLTSMTGFARTEGGLGDVRWHWELRAVNGKSLDIRLRTAPGFEALEAEFRALAAKHLRRGNCQLALQVSRENVASEIRVNEAALKSVISAVNKLASEVDAAPPSLDGLLAIKGVVELNEPEDSEETVAARNKAIMADLETALEALKRARKSEGARLEAVLREQIDTVERLTRNARECPARKPEAIKQRIGEQIARLTDQSTTFDPDRLHQEAVLIAAKVDVQEELDRLDAHVAAARDLLAEDEAVGRRLDFLTQEFNREANTLCSKANAPELTAIGLEMKAVIDQIREQVQNIE